MCDREALGLSSAESFKHGLALDVHLQVAGLEDIAGRIQVDIGRMAEQIVSDRDASVISRLADVIELRELSLMGDGEMIPFSAIEERAPHAAVVLAYETATAMAAIWLAFINASEKATSDGATG